MATPVSTDKTPYSTKIHRMGSGREVHGVSHSWANAVEVALEEVLPGSPDLQHVMIRVPKADRDVLRLFHSGDGIAWAQVPLSAFYGEKRFDIRAIARGARELDGDPAFPANLSLFSLRLREQAGLLVDPRPGRGPFGQLPPQHASLADWVETRARAIRDAAAELYVDGAGSEETRAGRRMSLVAIERLIDRLRSQLPADTSFALAPDDALSDAQIAGAIQDHFILRRYPFLTQTWDLKRSLQHLNKAERKTVARGFWADAAGLPRNARFDRIYGALLRSAEGHPVFGDRDYRKLEALLADALRDGFLVVRMADRLFVWSGRRWQPMREDRSKVGVADWTRGMIVSRNHGRVIVPPHWRSGELVPGYTRNGPGEGPSKQRKQPLEMRCVERPISGTDQAWLHAYHAWEAAQE
ncbi:hypothetical protein [Cereibacter sphaeroides]|uniref:hypothetical protein n=1 Tax=Cereibacter sphaeroides TaxID=1063 RepID=UPI003FCC3A8F